ncbi:MAG: hypothetical protein N2235_10305 [Fischerella sp.]|nr:hypothetical protein [Fischerella sp.]
MDRSIRAVDVEKEWRLLLQQVRSHMWDDPINSVEQATTVDEAISEVDAIFALIHM